MFWVDRVLVGGGGGGGWKGWAFTYHLDCVLISLSVGLDVAGVRKLDPDEQYPHEYREDPEGQMNVVVLLQGHGKDLKKMVYIYVCNMVSDIYNMYT